MENKLLNILIEMKENIVLKEHFNTDSESCRIPMFNEEWEAENLSIIVDVHRRIQVGTYTMEGCSRDDEVYICSAIDTSVENLKGRLCLSQLNFLPICKHDLFAVLTSLDGDVADLNGGDYMEKMERVLKGASNGGKALHADNVRFKKAYRAARDKVENKGKTRPQTIAVVEMGFNESPSFERWAKEADKEDGYKRKGGRPSKEKV